MSRLRRAIQAWKASPLSWMTEGFQHVGLQRTAKVFVVAVSVVSAISLAVLKPRMAPIKEGNPTQFWRNASGVELGPDIIEPWAMDAHLVDREWVAYELGGLHGTQIYRVAFKDILPQFNSVIESLQRDLENGKKSSFVQGYAKWRELRFVDDSDLHLRAQTLIRHQREALREVLKAAGIESSFHQNEQVFLMRWQRAKWYWANAAFEWVLFTSLAYFIAWPVWRGRSPIRWAAHAVLLPTLFLLPANLGYCATTFTTIGPSGGIVYPFLLWPLRGSDGNAFDGWVTERLPQILEPLSVSTGTWTAISGLGRPGPTFAIVAGFLWGVCALAAAAWLREAFRTRSGTGKHRGTSEPQQPLTTLNADDAAS